MPNLTFDHNYSSLQRPTTSALTPHLRRSSPKTAKLTNSSATSRMKV